MPSDLIPRVMDLRGAYKGGGGPDKTILNSAAQHDPGRVYVLVTYLRDPRDREFLISHRAQQLGLNYIDVPDRHIVDWPCLHSLKGILVAHRLTVLHVHDEKTLLYGWLLKLMTRGRLRIMYTCHSHAVYRGNKFMDLKDYFTFRMRRYVQVLLMKQYLIPILTVSQDTRNRLIASGIEERRVEVLYNGIDVDFWKRNGTEPLLRKELGIEPGVFLIGMVARISRDKDLSTFYRVVEEVTRQTGNAMFVVVGDGYGNELSRARAEVARRGLARFVTFTGHRSDLRQIYASLDLFLMTSSSEGLPNTLLEAMAMELPCVATNTGGIPELLKDGQEGLLAPVGDARGLAAHILQMIEDQELAKQCRRAARKRVEKDFSFARRVRCMEDYYAWFAGVGALHHHR